MLDTLDVKYPQCQKKALQNKHIKMAAVLFPPYLARYTDRNNKTRYTGLLWDFAKYIEKAGRPYTTQTAENTQAKTKIPRPE